jgi:hypothetical protein
MRILPKAGSLRHDGKPCLHFIGKRSGATHCLHRILATAIAGAEVPDMAVLAQAPASSWRGPDMRFMAVFPVRISATGQPAEPQSGLLLIEYLPLELRRRQ